MPNVYAWPPVGVVGASWDRDDPISVSRSIFTGADYVSTAGRSRRIANLNVSALAAGRSGGGYMEVLKRLLNGGVNLVRLNSTPLNWWLDADTSYRSSELVLWADGAADLEWTAGGTELFWFSGTLLTATTGTDAAGFPIITVSGCPANRLIARPGDFVTVFEAAEDTTGETIMVMTEATSNGSGVAVIRLLSVAPYAARVNIGTSETGVFRALDLPRVVQPLDGNWIYQWQFREVFEDEEGTFTEVNPWL